MVINESHHVAESEYILRLGIYEVSFDHTLAIYTGSVISFVFIGDFNDEKTARYHLYYYYIKAAEESAFKVYVHYML